MPDMPDMPDIPDMPDVPDINSCLYSFKHKKAPGRNTLLNRNDQMKSFTGNPSLPQECQTMQILSQI